MESPLTTAFFAGGCAGTSVDVALHPLDTLRTRLQSRVGFWKSGGFRNIYRGVLSATLGSAPTAAAFFGTYEAAKSILRVASGSDRWIQHSAASGCGEVAACFLRVPTAIVTQNMQVGRYATFREAVTSIWKSQGLRAFYVGYGTTVARELPFAFIQFPIYEALKKKWAENQGHVASPLQGAACGAVAGAIAGAVTTPLDVAKTRIMLDGTDAGHRRYRGTVQTLQTVCREEGFCALFRGIGPRVAWITLGGFIFFGAYEKSTALLTLTPL